MKTMWDERYASNSFIYGRKPNAFFKKQISRLMPGKILLPAEGEGRNAVFAARLGWEVVAFDNSTEARKKALKLASERGVNIDYRLISYDEFDYKTNDFDAIALIYAHVPGKIRQSLYRKMLEFLKPGGMVILEGFSKKQLRNNSGGPKDIDLLFSKEELKDDFLSLSEINMRETEITLNEGEFHKGNASVIRMTGKK
ncbi:MAG: class I SAM-dependent methyltransferase [Chlorobi bacterium]|nr:class I SAM-dependent methyltransferase [Chlorobiota bacterium]